MTKRKDEDVKEGFQIPIEDAADEAASDEVAAEEAETEEAEIVEDAQAAEEAKAAAEDAKSAEKAEKEEAKSKKPGFFKKVWKAILTAITSTLATIIGAFVADKVTGTKRRKSSTSTTGRVVKNATSAATRTITKELTRDILGNLK